MNFKHKEKASVKKRPKAKKNKTKSIAQQCRGKQCFAFDFGSSGIKVAVGKFTKSGADVSRLIIADNRSGLSYHDPAANRFVVRQLREALAEEGVSPRGGMALCTLDSGYYIRREMNVPYMENRDDLNGVLSFAMSEVLSLDVDAYFFNHVLLKRYKEGDKEMCTALVAAIERSACENYYKIFETLGMTPLLLDVNTNGMERYLESRRDAQDEKNVVCIDYGYKKTEIEIFHDGRLSQTSSLQWSEYDMIIQLRKIFNGEFDAEAENEVFHADPEAVYRLLVSEASDERVEELKHQLTSLCGEISDTLKLYKINNPSREISCILLIGGSEQFVWLRAYIEHVLGIKTLIADKPYGIRLSGKAQKMANKLPLFMNALNLFSAR